MTRDERLRQSGVRYRCACGAESEYQREAKLPPQWTMEFTVIEDRSWPVFRCPACAVLPAWRGAQKSDDVEATQNETRLEELRAQASKGRRGRKKR